MSRKLTTEEFIEKARAIHKDKYDYSKVEYVKASAKVVIICPEHGEFCQTPNKHISGKQGCPECKKLKIAQKLAFTHEKQVTSILKVNPNVEVLGEIIGDHKKVSCRCLICNHEWQPTPASLKQGEGCPKCAKRGFLSHGCGKLYVMVDDLEAPTMMKVGVSVRVEEERRKQILRSAQKAGVGISDLRVARTWEGSTEDILSLESAVHQIFSGYKVSFLTKFDGCNEFFYYRSEVFEEVEKLLTQA